MTSPKNHAERMAELRERPWRNGFRRAVFNDALAYADSLAAQLEAERSKVALLEKERDEANAKGRRSGYIATVGALHNALLPEFNICEPDPDKVIPRVAAMLREAEEKLRAAEGVVEAARCAEFAEGTPGLREALSAFDAINPDGSTGGANPSK